MVGADDGGTQRVSRDSGQIIILGHGLVEKGVGTAPWATTVVINRKSVCKRNEYGAEAPEAKQFTHDARLDEYAGSGEGWQLCKVLEKC